MLRTFIQITTLTLTLLSAYFLIAGILDMSLKNMTELSSTYFNHNLSALESYTKQKANTIVGFVFLLLSFILALINLLWPMRYSDFTVNYRGIMAALVLTIILFFISNYASKYFSNKWFEEGKVILTTDTDK